MSYQTKTSLYTKTRPKHTGTGFCVYLYISRILQVAIVDVALFQRNNTGRKLNMLLSELNKFLNQMRMERLLVISKIDNMERLLKFLDRNRYKIFEREIVQCFKNDGRDISVGRNKSCSTDFIVETLLNIEAVTLEETLKNRVSIGLATKSLPATRC